MLPQVRLGGDVRRARTAGAGPQAGFGGPKGSGFGWARALLGTRGRTRRRGMRAGSVLGGVRGGRLRRIRDVGTRPHPSRSCRVGVDRESGIRAHVVIRSASDHAVGRSTPATRSTAARSSGDNPDHWSARRESPTSSRGSTVSRTVSSLVRARAVSTQSAGSASVCDEVIQWLASVFGTEARGFEAPRGRTSLARRAVRGRTRTRGARSRGVRGREARGD